MTAIDNAIAFAVLRRVRQQVGAAVHTGLRKASDHACAGDAWHAINDLPKRDWDAVLDYAVEMMGIPAALDRPVRHPDRAMAERVADRLWEIGTRLGWWTSDYTGWARDWRQLEPVARKEFLGIAIALTLAAQTPPDGEGWAGGPATAEGQGNGEEGEEGVAA